MENSGLMLVPTDLLRRILKLLEETNEWIGEDFVEESERLQEEIEELLNSE